MITVSSFFSGTLNTVDAVIGSFVHTAYQHFMQANAGLITLLFTVYIMFLGLKFLYSSQLVSAGFLIKHIVLMLCVYGLVMNWQLYHLFVYNIFTTEPSNIAHILVAAASKSPIDGSIAKVLDEIYAAVVNATIGFFGQVSFSATGMAFIFYGILVFIIGTLMCIFALLLFVYAKMMMAIALALGPIFILFILWDATKGLFTAWLNKLITIALIPIVTSAILVLMLSVINITLPDIKQPIENLQFHGIAPFLGLSVATTLILSQVFRICSALGGGMALSSLSAGAAIVTSALQKAGIIADNQKIARTSPNQKRQNKKGQTRDKKYGGKQS